MIRKMTRRCFMTGFNEQANYVNYKLYDIADTLRLFA